MGNRPSDSDGNRLANPSTYDPYERGYRSGAQASIFVGPIWVEEVVSFSIQTQSSDVPTYAYCNPYYDNILLGRYQVTGQLAVAYTEPDYLLRIINKAASTSIQEEELANLIESRKSIFLDTVLYRMLAEEALSSDDKSILEVASEYATNYVNKITREIETRSLNLGGTERERAFEVTIITGDLYRQSQSIEIYEGVKIIGTGKTLTMDDNSLIEMYQFIGRKKPDRTESITKPRPRYILSKPNLMAMMREAAEELVEELLKPPAISITSSDVRTRNMLNTDKIAIAGHLPASPRLYGKTSSFAEIIYALEYRGKFSTYTGYNEETGSQEEKTISSETDVWLYRTRNSDPDTTDIYLQPPAFIKGSALSEYAFDNRFGRMIYPDRVRMSEKIAAVSPITPSVSSERIGGSIALPRYSTPDFEVGSYYPPEIVDLASFSFDEEDIEVLTAGTLWHNALGFRSTSAEDRYKRISVAEDEKKDEYISEVAQPLNTVGFISSIEADWDESEDVETFTLSFEAPKAIDFIDLDKTETKTTKSPMKIGKDGNKIVATIVKSSALSESSETDGFSLEGPLFDEHQEQLEDAQSVDKEGQTKDKPLPSADLRVYEDSELTIFYESIDAPEATDGDPDTLDPHYFETTVSMSSSVLASSLNKCVYVTPFVFLDNDSLVVEPDLANPGSYLVTRTPESLPSGEETIESYFSGSDNRTYYEMLAYFLKTRGGADSSCDIQIEYDCVVSDQSGYFNKDNNVSVYGVYFLKTSKDYDSITATDGTPLTRSGPEVNRPRQIHIFWVMTIMPILHLPTGVKDDDSGVNVTHNVEGPCGRYLEIYNITRCDSMLHNATFLADLNAGIWESIKNAIISIFADLLNIDTPITSYTYPVKAAWERFAGYLTGYSFRIDIVNIARQLLKCTFTESLDQYVNENMPADEYGVTWTLDKALMIAEEGFSSKYIDATQGISQDQTSQDVVPTGVSIPQPLFTEVCSVVRSVIESKVEEIGGMIVDRPAGRSEYTVDVEVLLPASNIVTYGLTEDGYEELLAYTQYNEEVGEVETDIITLGGYSE